MAPQTQYAPYVPVAPTKSRAWIVALAIGGSAVLLIIAVFVVFNAVWLSSPSGSTADGDYAHEPAASGDTTVETIVKGDCFDFPADSVFDDEIASWGDRDTALASRDCSEYHDFEAYSVSTVGDPSDDVYPGDDDLYDQIDTRCATTFSAYVGSAYEDSEVDYGYFYPSESSWADGDREAVCFAYLPDSDTNDSLRDSRR